MAVVNLKRILSAVLAAALCLLTACSGSEPAPVSDSASSAPTTATQSDKVISLAYSSTDLLDPYAAVTRYNKELCQLLYDSLLVLDSDFSPVYRLASSIEGEGRKYTVTIKDAVFSDGTTVTADDVVYSVRKAKAEKESKYAQQLSNVSSYSAASAKVVEFNLSKNDPYFENLLDFPILKSGSDELKNDDGKILPPIGGGRYYYDSDEKILRANPNYMWSAMPMETIDLIDTPDDESLEHNIVVGNISMTYSDLADNTPVKLTGQSVGVSLNNLIFLGINYNNRYLSDPRFRQAVSLALNRGRIASDAYYGYATAAAGPFPSTWKETVGLQTISAREEISRAVAILNNIGYNNKDNEGYFVNSAGERVTIGLLCNLDNSARVTAAQLIKTQLAAVGIYVDVRTVNWNAYLSELNSLSFDLYIGEIKLYNNMDISALVTEKSGACFGYIRTPDSTASSSQRSSSSSSAAPVDVPEETAENYVTVSAYRMVTDMYSGKATITDVMAAFNSELPVIPLCHRRGQFAYTADIAAGPSPTLDDLYFGIENITFK